MLYSFVDQMSCDNLIYLSKAFDNVNHDMLLQKLSNSSYSGIYYSHFHTVMFWSLRNCVPEIKGVIRKSVRK